MKYLGEMLMSIVMLAVIPDFKRIELERKFQDSIDNINTNRFRSYMEDLALGIGPNEIKLENPYRYGKIIYQLESKCRDSSFVDYGNKEKILMYKCKRYKYLLGIKKFETSKFAIIRTEVEEINNKTCN